MGKTYEDELECDYTPATSCGDLLLLGYYTDDYFIRPGGYGTVSVSCEMFQVFFSRSTFGKEELVLSSETSTPVSLNRSHEVIIQNFIIDKSVFRYDHQALYISKKSNSCERNVTIQCISTCISYLEVSFIGDREEKKDFPKHVLPSCACEPTDTANDR